MTIPLIKKKKKKQMCSDHHRVHPVGLTLFDENHIQLIFYFQDLLGFIPDILQNRTFPKVSGIFPIFHDFSNSLPVALRLYLQFFFHTLECNLSGPRGSNSFITPRFFFFYSLTYCGLPFPSFMVFFAFFLHI